MRAPVEPNIDAIVAYVPGKPADELKRELGLEHVVKLASNENPLGPSPLAIEAIKQSLLEVHLYPDGGSFYLKHGVAEFLDVARESLLLANGSNEAIEIILRTFRRPNSRIVTGQSSFIIYKHAATAAHYEVDEVPHAGLHLDLDAMLAAIGENTRFVFIANPNNPTGQYVGEAALTRFLERVPVDTLVVLDEAYCHYTCNADYPDGLKLMKRYPNLIVLRTFSKIYGLAGLRIGYAVLQPELANYCNRVRAPFNVNLIAQNAALASLADSEFVRRSVELNNEGMRGMLSGVREMGLKAADSAANFILLELNKPVVEVFKALLLRGVIVRPMVGYGMPYSARVTIGLPEENQRFLQALSQVL